MNSSKKILFLINKLGVGGAERVFIKNINFLSKLGYDVYLATLFSDAIQDGLINQISISPENIYICNAKNIYDIKSLINLRSFIIKSSIDTVYSTLNEANLISRLIKIFTPKLRVVIREANIADPKPIQFKIFDCLANIFVDSIICVSEEVRQSLCKYQPFFSDKMQVLMNGVFIPDLYKKYDHIAPRPLKIINVGSLTTKKGQKFIIEACAEVLKQRPGSVNISIYGKGVEEDNLKSLINKYKLENVIFIHEPVSSEVLSLKYLDSDLFILSSVHEGCPNVLLEAMAHGLACVSTKVSGAVSIVNPKTGILIDVGDVKSLSSAIFYMIDNYDRMAFFGENARKLMSEEFSIDAHTKKLIKILKL